MAGTTNAISEFHQGDEVVLAEGAHQGTLGVFLALRDDTSWADIVERNGVVRSHPLVWLAHSTKDTPGFTEGKIGAAKAHAG